MILRTTLFTAFAALGLSPAALPAQEPSGSEAVASDFSRVETPEQVQQLAEAGRLVPIHLFPVEFGGPDMDVNVVYVTPEAASARTQIVAEIAAKVEAGQLNQMQVNPSYSGKSLVPNEIAFEAWHTESGERFEPTIKVW